jgi:tripartite-type tricarboxylate transporter receptor subunit TctC
VRRRKFLKSTVLSGVVGGLSMPSVQAQEPWPNRPIRMIVPFAPGAATDSMARLGAQKLGEKLGVSVVVENRTGGNGIPGTQAVLQAPADGYTIMGTASTHALMRQVLRNVPFDPQADFIPVARTARGPMVLVTNPGRRERTVAEILAAARANPSKWSFATSSFGSAGHLATIDLCRRAGTDIQIVPYRGTAPALTDISAGNVQLLFDSAFALLPQTRANQVQGVAIATAERSHLAPELPTVAESGHPGFEFYSWYAVMVPKGTPAEIAARMNAALNEGMADEATRQRLNSTGLEPLRESIDEIRQAIAAEVTRGAELLRIANYQPE